MKRAVVIGGGVVGASAAFHLARAGVDTLLVDRRDAGHATGAGAGIISPGTSTRPLPAFFPFAKDAVAHYPDLVATLAEIGQATTRYEVVGELILAKTEEEFANLPALKALYAERRAGGMPNLGDVTDVDGVTAKEMFPALGDIHGALYVPEAARVDGDSLRNALVAGAKRHGAKIRYGPAALRIDRNRVTSISIRIRSTPTG